MPRTRAHPRTGFEPVDFTDEDRGQLDDFSRALQALGSSPAGRAVLRLPTGEHVDIPDALLRIMAEAAGVAAQGASRVRVVPDQQYVTTREAAALLNISRPHLVYLLDQEHIPYIMVGSHRRIPLDALLAYKRQKEARARQAFDELFVLNEDAGLYRRVKGHRAAPPAR